MQNLKELLPKSNEELRKNISSKHKYISQEFQDYGYRLALKLGDVKNAAMYIRICKEKPRAFIEQAMSFAIDYPKAKNKTRIFLWKMKQLTDEYNLKNGIVVEKKKKSDKEDSNSLFEGKKIKRRKRSKEQKTKGKKVSKDENPISSEQSTLF